MQELPLFLNHEKQQSIQIAATIFLKHLWTVPALASSSKGDCRSNIASGVIFMDVPVVQYSHRKYGRQFEKNISYKDFGNIIGFTFSPLT